MRDPRRARWWSVWWHWYPGTAASIAPLHGLLWVLKQTLLGGVVDVRYVPEPAVSKPLTLSFANAVVVASTVLAMVKMKVIGMGRIGSRAKDCGEVTASGCPHRCQCSRF